MKKLVLYLIIFCLFFGKNLHAQTSSKFSVEVEVLSGKKVLFYNGILFLGNKDSAEKLSQNNFISNTKNNIFVLKVVEDGQITKSVFLFKNHKWLWVTDETKNFVVDIKESSVTTSVTITFDNGDSIERFFFFNSLCIFYKIAAIFALPLFFL